MTDSHLISAKAASLNIANLDTDQIMPKQFLLGIDKKGLDKGVLWDLRFDGEGNRRPSFILNKPDYADTGILLAGPNFGCGSSREHAVWGLQQFGIKAVIASSFGEIFYSNAMNNALAAVIVSQEDMVSLHKMATSCVTPMHIHIDIKALKVTALNQTIMFKMSERHRQMFLDGLDLIGASMKYEQEIMEFARRHWAQQPWTKDVAFRTLNI